MPVYQGSRYVSAQAYVRRGEALILTTRERFKFNLKNVTYYTVVQGDTIDGIAYSQYGNAQLWWAIMDANPIYQIETEIKPGDVLAIPSFDEVVRVGE